MAKRPNLKNLASHISPKGGDGASAAKAPAKGSKATKPGEDKTKYLQTRVNIDGWQALRILSAEQNMTMQALFIEALNDLLRKHRKAPVVEGPPDD
jgi:hypothetical protein